MGNTIALVACVSKKRDTSMAARELYISNWFKKASAYSQQTANEWYILSALYGLIKSGCPLRYVTKRNAFKTEKDLDA